MNSVGGLIHIKVLNGDKTVFYDSFSRVPISINNSPDAPVSVPLDSENKKVNIQVVLIDGKPTVTLEQVYFQAGNITQKTKESFEINKQARFRVNEYEFSFVFETFELPELPTPTTEAAPQAYPAGATHHGIPVPAAHQDLVNTTVASNKLEKTVIGRKGISALDEFKFDAPRDYLQTHRRRPISVEAILTWKGQVLDSRFFQPNENISIGKDRRTDLYSPQVKKPRCLGRFDGKTVTCYIKPKDKGYVQSDSTSQTLKEVFGKSSQLSKHYNFVLEKKSTINYEIAKDTFVHLRYAQRPRQLSKRTVAEPDELMKRTSLWSGAIHLLLLILMMALAPKQNTPKIKQVPDRIAKLLVMKKPIVKKKKIVKKEKKKPLKLAKRKPQRKPKKVVVKPNPKIKVVNKKPFVRKKPTKNVSRGAKKAGKAIAKRSRKNSAPAKVNNIKSLGALAALGALAPPKSANGKLAAVRINTKTSKGGTTLSTSGLISQVQSGETRVPASTGVKTNGRGFGSKDGYDVNGLSGEAGRRGVAGQVIGQPKLYKFSKTEGLNRNQVMKVVQKNAGKIQSCYEKSLLSNPALAGRVEYKWKIQASGKVSTAQVKRSELRGADRLNECVLRVFRKMKFPVAKNGQTTEPEIGFPFGQM